MCSKLDITNLCQDLSENTKKELVEVAKHCGLPNYSKFNKAELCRELADYLVSLQDPSNEEYFSKRQITKSPQFSRSLRPVTNMYTLTSGRNCAAGKLYLPVVRYGGLYYFSETSARDYTGTFYFYEPDSCSFLDLGNVLIAGSKYDAFKKLWKQGGDRLLRQAKYLKEAMSHYELEKVNDPEHTRQFPAFYYRYRDFPMNPQTDDELMFALANLTPEEQEDYAPISGLINSFNSLPMGKIHTVVDYSEGVESEHIASDVLVTLGRNVFFGKVPMNPLGENKEGLYLGNYGFGFFDGIDIPLYLMGKELGYDTILLQHEYGEYRSVTEILDIRPRNISYESICRIPDCSINFGSDNHPLIWLPKYGFLKYDPITETFM